MSQLLPALLLAVCISILSVSISAQSRWSLVGMTDDRAVWLVDKAVLKKKSGVIAVWEKVIYVDGSYSVGLNEWRCKEKMKRFIQVNNYDSEGGYISRGTIPLPWRYVVPDAIEEKTYKIVCANTTSRETVTDIESNSSFAQIIKKSNLMSEASPRGEVIRKVAVGEKLALISEEPVGVWYQVLDPQTNSEGWLNGNHFKIVKATKSPAKKPGRKKKRKLVAEKSL